MIRRAAIAVSLLAAIVRADSFQQTNDVFALHAGALQAQSGVQQLTIHALSGGAALNLSGATSVWTLVDSTYGQTLLIPGRTLDETGGVVQFTGIIAWPGTFAATATVYGAGSAFDIGISVLTVTNAQAGGAAVSVTQVNTNIINIQTVTNEAPPYTNAVIYVPEWTNSVPAILMGRSGSYFWQTSYGPTSGLANVTYYTNRVVFSALNSMTSYTQSWQVGASTTQIWIKAWGGGGGGGVSQSGGSGGFAWAVVPVTPLETLSIVVGKAGYYNGSTNRSPLGGGIAVVNSQDASGGGASAVFRGPVHVTNAIVIAAGGGGGSGGGAGGSGGSTTGANGSGSLAGSGGSQTTNGANGNGNTNLVVFLSGWYWAAQSRGGLVNTGAGGGGMFPGGSGSTNSAGGGGSCLSYDFPNGYLLRGNNSGDVDYQSSWGTGGSSASAGTDGGIVIRY